MKSWDEYVALWEAIQAYVSANDSGTRESLEEAVTSVNSALAKYAGFDEPSYPEEGRHGDDVHGQAEHHESLHSKEPSA